MRFSFSRIETFLNCPYKFKLRYVDGLNTLPDYDKADNPLTIGSAMHHGIEKGVDEAIKEYVMSYPVSSTEIETEAMKLEILVPKVRAMINPNAMFEFKIETRDFLGFADYIDPETHTLLDFKYSNNKAHYLKSPQIHLYKYLLHKRYGMRIDRIGYLFIPKVKDERNRFETEELYRIYLREELENLQPEICYVPYDENAALRTLGYIGKIENVKTYQKNQKTNCWYCEYREYCESDGKEDYMILPKNEKRITESVRRRRLWVYGQPFSGKTTLADKFPDVLMLNTDGNINYVSAPYIAIKDEVKVDGHITRTTLAWDVFKDTIDELAKKQNDFKSIVVDLVEDTYEACRLYMYKKLGISHESDNSFKAWDMVRTEFLSTIKKLMNLDYENIILISHEDSSKDITKRGGDSITSIKPNIQDKLANKIAGMVDVVIRAVVIDGDHKLTFKSDEVVFGGGRINFPISEIENDYDKLIEVYESVSVPTANRAGEKAPVVEPKTEENNEVIEDVSTVKDEPPVVEDKPNERPARRRRR